MAQMRDKLIELIQNAVGGCARHWAELIADALIDNGVTLQQWIPVSERLPGKTGSYIVQSETGAVFTNRFYAGEILANGCCGPVKWAAKGKKKITHWMPLPEPPKENANDTD
jgi:hypothetical protein